MNKQAKTHSINISEIESLKKSAENGQLNESDLAIVISLCVLVLRLLQLIEEKNMSIARLKKSIFGSKSEKRKVDQNKQTPSVESNPALVDCSYPNKIALENNQASAQSEQPSSPNNPAQERKRKPGHGRLSTDDYTGAKTIYCSNTQLQPKDKCPHQHCKGQVYDTKEPQVLIERLDP